MSICVVAMFADVQYAALLQVVKDDPYLCMGIREGDADGMVLEEEEEDDDWTDWTWDLADWGRTGSTARRLESSSDDKSDADGDMLRGIHVEILGDGSGGNEIHSSNETRREDQQREINTVPSHEVPVAILAKRGQCSYETKAKVAQTLASLHGTVRFLIVYNDNEREGQRLITMTPKTRGNKWNKVGDDVSERLV